MTHLESKLSGSPDTQAYAHDMSIGESTRAEDFKLRVHHLGSTSAKHTVHYSRMWLAVFVAQAAYGLAMVAIMTLIVGTAVVGALTVDALLSGLLAVVAFALLTMGSVFIVPVLIKMCVRTVTGLKVGFGWAFFSNLAGWFLTTVATSLLWLIPGTQPLLAFLSLLGASALTAYLVARRAQ